MCVHALCLSSARMLHLDVYSVLTPWSAATSKCSGRAAEESLFQLTLKTIRFRRSFIRASIDNSLKFVGALLRVRTVRLVLK
jgi:hypothetical protein